MSVSDGQDVNAAVTNAAFLSRLVDSDTIGEVDLKNASYTDLISLQRIINEALSSLGISNQAATDANANVHSSNNTGIDGNDRKAALGILDALFNAATGHSHDGTAGQGPKVSAADLSNFNNLFAEFGEYTFDAASSTSIDVTSLFSSQSSGGSSSTEGVITSAPNNYVPIVEKTTGGEIEDAQGDRVFGRLTESGGTWTLSFFTNESGTETAHSLASQNIRFLYREVFTAANRPTIGANVAVYDTQSAIGDIPDASASQRGVVNTGAQTFQGAKNFLVRPTVNSNDVVDVSAAQTITFKDIDGGTASNTSRVTLPKNTTAGLTGLTRKEGTVFYDTTEQNFFGDNGTDIIPLGGGAGVGGGLDVWHTENFEDTLAADFTSGNNATFGVAGTFNGALADETVSPIASTSSLKYTQASGSLNDWFKSPVISIDNKQSGNTSGITLYFTYTGDPGDIQFVFYDETGAAILTASEDTFTTQSNPTRYSTSVSIPSATTSVSWGAQVKVENIGAILVVDDVEFSTDPFVIQNIFDTVVLEAVGNASEAITANVTDIPFIGTLDESGSWSGSVFTAPSDAIYEFGGSVRTASGASMRLSLYKNGAIFGTLEETSLQTKLFSGTIKLEAGQTISFRMDTSTTLQNVATLHYLNINAVTSSPALITPAKSNLTDWEAFTPTASWTGNVTTEGFKRRVGDTLEIQLKIATIAAPTPSATGLKITIPDSLNIDTSKMIAESNQNNVLGITNARDSSTTSMYMGRVMYDSSQSVSLMYFNDVGTREDVGIFLDTVPFTFANGDEVFAHFSVPIAEWKAESSFLAAIPEDLGVKPALYYAGAATAIPTGVETKVGFNTVETDQDSLVADPTTNWRYICKKDGVYEVVCGVGLPSASVVGGNVLYSRLYINGSPDKLIQLIRMTGSVTENFNLHGSSKVVLSKGDEITIYAFQNSDPSLNTSADKNFTYVSITREQTPVSFGGDIRQESLIKAADGTYTGGNFKITRIGSQVTISAEENITHASASARATSTGFIPSWAIPKNDKSNVYFMTGTRLQRLYISTAGAISTDYYDFAGSPVNLTSAGPYIAITYNVD